MKTPTTAPSIGGSSRGRLKAARHLLLPAAFLLGFAALAPTSKAQAKLISIKNVGTATVKVCVYKAHDQVQLLPERCWELGENQTGEWNRNDNSDFHVQLFKPGIIDEHLCYRNNVRGDAYEIEVASKPCTIVAKTLTVLPQNAFNLGRQIRIVENVGTINRNWPIQAYAGALLNGCNSQQMLMFVHTP